MTTLNSTSRAKRTYNSAKRQRQAEETRQNILGAARGLFAQDGYAGTTLQAIAAAAGVSSKTVLAVFRSKQGILAEVLEPTALARNHEEMLAQMRTVHSPAAGLALVARLTCEIYQASAPALELLRAARVVIPTMAQVSTAVDQLRRQQLQRLIRTLRQQGALRVDRTDEEAIDELWALTSFDLYRLLVLLSGWLPERYEMWLSELLMERLLASYSSRS